MIEQAALQDYFAARMGGDVKVTRFKRTFPGISRETFLVWTEEGGAEGGYVFRTDALGGPICPVPLEYEYRIIAGPPLVKAAIGEDSTEEDLGGAETHATVTGLGEYLSEDDAHAIALARELLDKLKWDPVLPQTAFVEPLYDEQELLGIVPADKPGK